MRKMGYPGQRESAVEKHLVRQVREAGGIAAKHVSPGRAGDPDRLVAMPVQRCPTCGRGAAVALLELKRPGEAPRPLQQARIEQWLAVGVRAGYADSPGAVDQFLRSLR